MSQFEGGPILDWAAVVLPTLLAIVGVWVSIESPRVNTRKKRRAWRFGLLAFGVLVSAVTYAQQKAARIKSQEEFVNRYKPAGILVYEGKRFIFYNKAKSTLYFWGDKLASAPKQIEPQPRVLPVDAFYYLFGDKFEEVARQIIGANGEDTVPFEMFFKNEIGEKYTAVFTLLVRIKNDNVEVHTQMLSFDKSDW